MTTAVRQLLTTFEALPVSEQREAALEILKRASFGGDISEEGLVEAAAELFREMDAEEARHAAS